MMPGMSAILVTGGAGFVGSHVAERLLAEEDDRLVVVDNFNDYYDPQLKRANAAALAANPRVTVEEADVNDLSRMLRLLAAHRVRAIVHLAASPGVPASLREPVANVSNNVLGLVALLEAARQHSVERFVFASSSSIYGQGAAAPFVEDAPLGIPLSPYAAAKRAGELLGLMYWQVHRLPFVALRLFNVYGPRLRPELALAVFTRAILAGQPVPLYGDGSIRRDFTHVSDICAGFVSALRTPAADGQCINLGNDRPVAIADLIRLVEQAAGQAANVERRPPRPEDMPATHADLHKAQRLLNYRPSVAIEQGVADYVGWYKLQGAA
jgi:UDP-glucuronate 4-epimerase